MKLWPFDILEPDMSEVEINGRLDDAVAASADATIVYIEEEHMYGTFVDEAGFEHIQQLLRYLCDGAHLRALRVLVYLNGLEVMTRDAVDPETCAPRSTVTMFSQHPDWVQRDLEDHPIVFSCIDEEWLTPDMEDAWISPFSPYRDLFKSRIASIGEAGADAIYIDATFMPGLQLDEENPVWGSTDAASAAAFVQSTGFSVPEAADWENPAWRSWLLWRHEAIRAYLAELADAAWDAGMAPFWESSTSDTDTTSLLGNETAITSLNPMGFSPEIEPEGDLIAAFRMMESARDFAPEHPLIYLGWPLSRAEAEEQLAVALSFSGNLYPTADAPYPPEVYAFADSIRREILDTRKPYWGKTALIYSTRNKDWSYPDSSHFESYDEAFRDLTAAHLPFRILVLEEIGADDLRNFDTLILPGVISISDGEFALFDEKKILARGEVGTRDENWERRPSPLVWSHPLSTGIEDLETGLPFEIDAPSIIFLSFFEDGTGGWVFFALPTDSQGGVLEFNAEKSLNLRLFRPDAELEKFSGKTITTPTLRELGVCHLYFEDAGPRLAEGRAGDRP